MSTPYATITLDPAGNATVSFEGRTETINAADIDAARNEARSRVTAWAQESNQPIPLHVNEPLGAWDLTVYPDGDIDPLSKSMTGLDSPSKPEDPAPQPVEPTISAGRPQNPTHTPGAAAPSTRDDQQDAWAQDSNPAPIAPATAESPTSAEPAPAVPVPVAAATAPASPVPAPTVPSPEPPATVAAPAPAVDPVEQDPRWASIADRPATQGFRGTVNRMLGLSLAAEEPELAERRQELAQTIEHERLEQQEAERQQRETAEQESRQAARAREAAQREAAERKLIQTNFQGVRTVLIANPKGGARKTTTTYLLAATMGIIRGGSVIAWDANETMGTLGDRGKQDLHENTVVDLLEESASRFTSLEGSRLGALDRYVRPQGDCHFDLLASDDDATRQDIVDAAGFATVHEILSRFYRLILLDTGNNIRASHFLAAVDQADQLVIPVAAGRDSARVAQQMMRSLTASGHDDLVKNAVILLHDLEPSTDANSDYLTTVRSIVDGFEGQVAAVVAVPFDPALKAGDEIDYEALSPATQRAYREAAAAVATGLRTRLRQELR